MDHWIARHILRQLLTRESAKWSELRPEGVTDNLFGYYMKRLVASGIVAHDDTTWALTDKGRTYLSDVSLDTMRETKSPKLCVMIAAECGQLVAVYKWRRAPYAGRYSVPYGRWHRGDSVVEAIQAEAVEKLDTELNSEECTTDTVISLDESAIHEAHVVAHVTLNAVTQSDSDKGQLFWVSRRQFNQLAWATPGHRQAADMVYGSKPHASA